MFDNEQTKLYMSMMDQQLSRQLSSRGIGLADVMIRQLARARGTQPPAHQRLARGGRTPAGCPDGGPAGQPRRHRRRRPAANRHGAAGNAWGLPPAFASTRARRDWQQGGQSRLGRLPDAPPAHISNFGLNRLAGPAVAASRASGRAGQAGRRPRPRSNRAWGRRRSPIRTAPPRSACSASRRARTGKGATAEVLTTECVDGLPRRFGPLPCLRLLRRSVRRLRAPAGHQFALRGVVAASTAAEAAHGLQRAGHATDPAYGREAGADLGEGFDLTGGRHGGPGTAQRPVSRLARPALGRAVGASRLRFHASDRFQHACRPEPGRWPDETLKSRVVLAVKLAHPPPPAAPESYQQIRGQTHVSLVSVLRA